MSQVKATPTHFPHSNTVTQAAGNITVIAQELSNALQASSTGGQMLMNTQEAQE